jgi:hypothetical protein
MSEERNASDALNDEHDASNDGHDGVGDCVNDSACCRSKHLLHGFQLAEFLRVSETDVCGVDAKPDCKHSDADGNPVHVVVCGVRCRRTFKLWHRWGGSEAFETDKTPPPHLLPAAPCSA